jgi:hypothetical protein
MEKEKEEKLRKKKKKLAETFYKKFYSIVKDNPKVRKVLTEREIENGLQTLINRIVEEIMEKEQKLGRELTLEEIKNIVINILNEFTSRTGYIV